MREEKKEMNWNNNEQGESQEDFKVLSAFNTLCGCFLYYTFKPIDFNMYYRLKFAIVLVLSTCCVGTVCNPYLNHFIWICISYLNLPKCWCFQHIVLVLSVIYIQIFDLHMYYKFELPKCWCFQHVVLVLSVIHIQIIWFEYVLQIRICQSVGALNALCWCSL